jgi:thiosulfate/3-mercaptopyruvate sulfurtransferase
MVEELTPEELKRRLDAGEDVLVVDIRGEAEFRHGHIPGAVNVPFHSFARAVEDRDWRGDVVMACPVGQSSEQAARLLESYEGVDPSETTVYNLEGGYRAWEYELASGAGHEGSDGDGSSGRDEAETGAGAEDGNEATADEEGADAPF